MNNKYVLAAAAVSLILVGAGCGQPRLGPGNEVINAGSPTDRSTEASQPADASRILDLSGRGLQAIPAYVFDRTDLEELNVSNNRLTGAIPAEIGRLQSLKILDASHNEMTGVPAEIGRLSELQVLDLSYNKLTGLPYELGNLAKLQVLDLSGNAYSQIDLDHIRQGLPNTRIITK